MSSAPGTMGLREKLEEWPQRLRACNRITRSALEQSVLQDAMQLWNILSIIVSKSDGRNRFGQFYHAVHLSYY